MSTNIKKSKSKITSPRLQVFSIISLVKDRSSGTHAAKCVLVVVVMGISEKK